MSAQEEWKRKAAEGVAELVEDGMSVGLGSGSTLAEVVRVLGERGKEAEFVAASIVTHRLAEKMGLHLDSLGRSSELDIAIDGADEVDPDFAAIKGGGGAHTREKIVASAAKEVVIVVDKTKLVEKLGERNPVPVEVVPFAHRYTARLLEDFGGRTRLRKAPTGGPYVTDNGNYIVDLEAGVVEDPEKFERELNEVPGVIENGIFVDMIDRIFVGHEDGCEVLESGEDFLKLSEGDLG